MIRLYFTGVLLVLTIIPRTVDSFFLGDVATVNATQQINCSLSDNGTSSGGFQVCALRVYSGTIGGNETTINVYNGFRYVNIFTQFILQRCPTDLDTWGDNIGSGNCGQPQSYETFGSVQLCICATDNCNQDLVTCQRSVKTITTYQLSALIPSLTTTVQCQDTLNASNICTEHPFIDISLCQQYVKNNSVLCAITIQGTQPIQTSWIYDSYAAFLDEQIYEVKLAFSNGVSPAYNETSTNVYYEYSINALGPTEECFCANYSSCNQDINTCVSQPTVAVQSITTSASITSTNSIGTSGSTSASVSSTNSIGTSGSTSASVSGTNSIGTSGSTSASISGTDSVATSGSTPVISATTNSIATSESSSMTPTTTNSIGMSAVTSMNPATTNVMGTSASSSMTPTTTNSIATSGVTSMNPATTNVMGTSSSASMTNNMTIMSSDSSPITSSSSTTVQPAATPTSSNGQSEYFFLYFSQQFFFLLIIDSGGGETGLGRAATAGIACGIIFTAAIVAAEIVYFNFFFGGAARASAYLA